MNQQMYNLHTGIPSISGYFLNRLIDALISWNTIC